MNDKNMTNPELDEYTKNKYKVGDIFMDEVIGITKKIQITWFSNAGIQRLCVWQMMVILTKLL